MEQGKRKQPNGLRARLGLASAGDPRDHVSVGHEYALDPARRARRVENRRGVGLRDPVDIAENGIGLLQAGPGQNGLELGRVDEDGAVPERRQLVSCLGGDESEDGLAEPDQVADLGGGAQGVRGGHDDAEGEESEVDDGEVEGKWREDEDDVVLGEGREAADEEGRESAALRDEARVGDPVAGGGVDEERRGGGGGEDGEEEVGERNGEGRRRERDGGPEAAEGPGFGAEAIDGFDFFGAVTSFRHREMMKMKMKMKMATATAVLDISRLFRDLKARDDMTNEQSAILDD